LNKRKVDTHSLLHNPGYDFLRQLKFLKNANPYDDACPIPEYFIPVIALLCGCCSIEGYVNSVGKRTNPSWNSKTVPYESIKSRIKRVYELVGIKVNFSRGPYKEALDLFGWRRKLVHPEFVHESKAQKKELPDIFDQVSVHYFAETIEVIVVNFKDRLLLDFNLDDVWQRRGRNITELERIRDT
jgi:hypothetical protein